MQIGFKFEKLTKSEANELGSITLAFVGDAVYSLLPLSLQQPLVTGGVIAFAFIISLLIGEKKKPKDIAAFAVACLSMAAILLNYI